MSVRSGQSITVLFTTRAAATGVATNATGTPTGTLYVNGTADAATVTVTNITTGVYKAAVTLPTLAAGDIVGLSINATVSGVADNGVIWGDTKDLALDSSYRPGIDWSNVGAPTTSLALTGTTIATTQQVDVNTIKTQTVTCAAGVTVGAFVGNATAAIGVTAAGRIDVGLWLGTAPLALSSQQVQAIVPDTQKVDLNTIKTQTVTCAAGVTVLASVGTATTSTAQTGDSFARLTGTGAVTFASLAVSGTTTFTGKIAGINATNDLRINGYVPGDVLGGILANNNVASLSGLAVNGSTTLNTFTVTSTTTLVGVVTATNASNDIRGIQVGDLTAGALSKYFLTDSGTTYASAVAGSVVKEIVSNSGGSPPTPAAIATAVWQDTTAGDFTVAGSIGKSLGGSFTALGTSVFTTGALANAPTGGTAPTVSQIATAVWQDTTAGDFTVASSIGKSLYTAGAVPGAAGGLFIAGTNAATTVTTAFTTTFTGNLTGNVNGTTGGLTAAGWAGAFLVDSGEVYADAVNGSVVKEIGSNASGLSEADVRNAVGLASANLDAQIATLAVPGSSMTLSSGERNAIATALLDLANGVETSWTLRQAMRIVLSALGGRISGASTGTLVFRDVNNTVDRITAACDIYGDRTNVNYDVS